MNLTVLNRNLQDPLLQLLTLVSTHRLATPGVQLWLLVQVQRLLQLEVQLFTLLDVPASALSQLDERIDDV